MTYFYNREDLPEVVKEEESGCYLIEGRRFLPSDINTEENIQNEIEIRLALLHAVQDENDASIFDPSDELDDEFDAPTTLDDLVESADHFFATVINFVAGK